MPVIPLMPVTLRPLGNGDTTSQGAILRYPPLLFFLPTTYHIDSLPFPSSFSTLLLGLPF